MLLLSERLNLSQYKFPAYFANSERSFENNQFKSFGLSVHVQLGRRSQKEWHPLDTRSAVCSFSPLTRRLLDCTSIQRGSTMGCALYTVSTVYTLKSGWTRSFCNCPFICLINYFKLKTKKNCFWQQGLMSNVWFLKSTHTDLNKKTATMSMIFCSLYKILNVDH